MWSIAYFAGKIKVKGCSFHFLLHFRKGEANNKIVAEKEPLRWEKACSGTESFPNRLFLSTLLEDADICVLAGYNNQQIITGAIANRTGRVVGLSNVFTPPDEYEQEQYWEGLLAMIGTHFPTLPIVGYERDESLTLALHVGFTMLAPLCVWIKVA